MFHVPCSNILIIGHDKLWISLLLLWPRHNDRLTHNIVHWMSVSVPNVFRRSNERPWMSIDWTNETKEKTVTFHVLYRAQSFNYCNSVMDVPGQIAINGTITYFAVNLKPTNRSIDGFFFGSKRFQFIHVPWKLCRIVFFSCDTHESIWCVFNKYMADVWCFVRWKSCI